MLRYNLEEKELGRLRASSTGVLLTRSDVVSLASALFSRLSKSPRKVLGYICSCWWGGGVATAMTEEVMQEPTATVFHGDGGVEKNFFSKKKKGEKMITRGKIKEETPVCYI